MSTNKYKNLFLVGVLGGKKNTIAHSEKFLPELDIQAGFRKFLVFCKRVGSVSRDSTFNFALSSIYTR